MAIEDVQVTVKKKRGRPQKKKIITIAERKPTEKKESKKSVSKVGGKKKKGGSFFHHLIVMIITASIVGGAIYFWQKSTGEDGVNKVRKEARSARFELENKIKRITDKMKGIEYENTELKTVNEKLKDKASLLDEAKRDFKETEIGFNIDYPAIFGNIDFKITESETGKIYRGEFIKNKNIIFGGSSQFNISTSTSINTVLNTNGFVEKKDKFYFISESEELEDTYLFNPFEIMDIDGMKILFITKHSFDLEDEEVEEFESDEEKATTSQEVLEKEKKNNNIFLDLEGEKSVAAIINLNNETFKGVTILNKNTDELSFKDFKRILQSVEVK
ncbi:hypothetical protein KAI92_00130 [Candidatus Parcubacteria bacterium]|nr:hypothetical protein [Candidatus Parcubacteria bacterium]